MLTLLIHSYPLPCPALVAFELYRALLERLLKCPSSHLAVALFTSRHQNIPRAGECRDVLPSSAQPGAAAAPRGATSAGAAVGPVPHRGTAGP